MRLADHEQQRTRVRDSVLSRHYRSIGPAAIIAALMFRRPAYDIGGRSR